MDEIILTPDEAIAIGTNEVIAMIAAGVNLAEVQHPACSGMAAYWEKWRRTYEAGDDFIQFYLERYSTRESDTDFQSRMRMSYCPAFAASAVNEIKDSIFQRTADVMRQSKSETYNAAVIGKSGGVDGSGMTMNNFIGKYVLPEMLSMRKVGVFIDMPDFQGNTLSDQRGIAPYLYHYQAENIKNWEVSVSGSRFTKLLLCDSVYDYCPVTGLPTETTARVRYMWVRGGITLVQFFNDEGKPVTRDGQLGIDVRAIELPEIPFVTFEITHSLLKDVCGYQISLLNLASSDIAYALKCNFPFYVEQFDPRSENPFLRPAGQTDETGVSIIRPGEQQDAVTAKNNEITVGTMQGRRVPKGLELPRYIHPSAEPLTASMAKQDELKKDIRNLVKLATANLAPKMASAESKSFDERGLESGLSAIGLELQNGEDKIARYWQMYEGISNPESSVKYPARYDLQNDSDKRKEAKDMMDSTKAHPSVTYKKSAYKLASETLLGSRVPNSTLEKIRREIEAAEVIVSDPEELSRDVELGLVDPQTASTAKGYPKDSYAKAKVAHADRVKRIAESQAKARGTPDLGGLEDASRDEKMEKDDEDTAGRKTRGEES